MLWKVYYKPTVPCPPPPEIRLGRARDLWNTWFPVWLQDRVPAYRFETTRIGV
jgi:hypothetical protein